MSWLEGLSQDDWRQYHSDSEVQESARNALALLLREQEPTTYAYDEYMTPTCQNCGFHPFIAYIPTLERMEQKGYNYCPGCGREVKWDDAERT